MRLKFLHLLALIIFCSSNVALIAQQTVYPTKSFAASGDVFGTRNFVENKGAYQHPLKPSEPVDFIYECAGEKIYFSKTGITYELVYVPNLEEHEKEELEEKGLEDMSRAKKYFVQMQFQNAQNAVEITGQEKQSHYFTYGTKELNAYAFKKLLYKNVYPNIDLVYEIPSDKAYGIKYSFVLHPGADESVIDLLYSGDIKRTKTNEAGDIIFKTPLYDITEHAPISYYADGKAIASAFSFKDNHIKFQFNNEVDRKKEIIIDPWITALTSLTNDNNGFDVDFDFSGNTYVYGGNTANAAGRCKVAKYNSTGVLLWTFSGIITTPTWNSGVSWSSNFKVNRGLGKTYVSRNNGTPNAIRLDVNGNYDNWITFGSTAVGEVWAMDLICNGDLLVFGGAATSGEIASTQTGSITLVTTFSPGIVGCCQDIVSYAIDATGDMFVYFLGHTQLNHKIGKLSQTFTTSIWHAPSTFGVFQYLQNKTLYQGGNSGNAVAFNALAVNMNYLFYYDGLNVAAYNKSNGSLVGSTSIVGQTGRQQGGIAVDECNNVYVGSIGSIKCFNFNGTSFSTLTPIPLNTTLTNQYVYDIALNSFNNTLFVSGSGLAGSYAAIHSTNCPLPAVANPCSFGQGTITAQTTSITCANLGSATVSAVGGMGPFTYTWLPSMTQGSVISGVSPGTHSVVVTDQGANFTYTALAIFTPLVPLSGQISSTGSLPCFGMSTGTATPINLQGGSGNQSYIVTNGITTQTTPIATNLTAGTYTSIVTDALTGCQLTQQFSIIEPPLLGSFIVANTPTACVGDSISFTNIVSGGVPSYTCNWVGGPSNCNTAFTSNISGQNSFSVISTDANQCTTTAVAFVTFVPLPTLVVPSLSICPLQTATLQASGASTYSWNGVSGNANNTVNPLATTVYTLSGSALGCNNTTTTQVTLLPVPIAGYSSNSPLCEGQQLQLTASGGSSYYWTGPQSFTSSLVTPTIAAIPLSKAGVYNVTVTAANGCTASTNGTVVVNQNPIVSAVGSTVCTQQTFNLSAISSIPCTFTWYGPLAFSNSNQNPSTANAVVANTGSYTVIGTTANGCTNTAVAHVSVTPPPTIGIAPSTTTMCAQGLNGSLNTITLVPSGGISYNIATSANVSNQSISAPFVISAIAPFASSIAPASATIIGSNGVCTSSASTVFTILPNPVISIVSSTPQLCAGLSYTYNLFGASSYSFTSATTGLSFIAANGSSAIATPTVSTVYSALGSSLGCLSAIENTTISVYPIPTLTVSKVVSDICYGTSTTLFLGGTATNYQWTPLFGLSAANTATVGVKPFNTTAYTIIGTANGCTTSISATVNVLSLPQPTAVSDRAGVCLYDTIVLKGSGGENYWWRGPNFYYESGKVIKIPAISPGLAGTYTLIVKDQKGCFDSTSTSVSVFTLPEATLNFKQEGACVPYCPTFTFNSNSQNSAVKGVWKFAGRTFSDSKFLICFTEAGTYSISGTLFDTVTLCKNDARIFVEAYPLPLAEFTWLPKEPIESFEEVKFTNMSSGAAASSYAWQIKDEFSISASTTKNTAYTWMTHGVYPVALVITTEKGCSDTAVHVIKVLEDFTSYMPNSFTPNGDGNNDVFMPVIRAAKNLDFHIYDRWGAELYGTTVIGEGWDGSYKGKACKEDVYTWTMGLTTMSGERVVRKGEVTLLR